MTDLNTSLEITNESASESKPKQPHKNITYLQGVLIIILLAMLIKLPLFELLTPTPKWEYKIEEVSYSMDKYGKEGWELVTAIPISSKYGVTYRCVFKRPK